MCELIVATKNEGKLREIRDLLKDFNLFVFFFVQGKDLLGSCFGYFDYIFSNNHYNQNWNFLLCPNCLMYHFGLVK